jgi:hypothetical protein
MLKTLKKCEKKYFSGKNNDFSPSFPVSILGSSAGNCHIALVDESGMIRTQMGTHNRSQIVAVLGTPCAIPRHNSNSTEVRELSGPRMSEQSFFHYTVSTKQHIELR